MSSINKTIWIFNQYAIKPEFSGGTRHYDLAKQLVLQGYSVHIFAAGFHYLLLKEVILKSDEDRKEENIEGVDFHWLRVTSYSGNGAKRLLSMISFYFSLIKEFNYLKKNQYFQTPDIVIGSSVHLFAVLAAYRVAKSVKARFIMEIRDLWPYTMISTGQMSRFNPVAILFGIIERFLYKRAELVISLLENACQYIGQYTNPEKVIWIPNSFNTENLNTLDHCQGLGIIKDPEKLTILFAGSINENDGVLVLVKAYEKVKHKIEQVRLVIIGDGMDKTKIEDYVNSNNLKDVILMPAVPKNKILCYLSIADVLWVGMPDSDVYKYGLSFNKLYDYMAVSKPILFSSTKYGNIIRDADCGIISRAMDENDLSNKILEFVYMDPNQRNVLGANGYKYVMDNFTTELIAKKLINEVIERSIKITLL